MPRRARRVRGLRRDRRPFASPSTSFLAMPPMSRRGRPRFGQGEHLIMVWLARQDLVRAVDLLEQHDASKLVRQRHLAERDAHVAALEVEPAWPPDHEAEVAARLAAL